MRLNEHRDICHTLSGHLRIDLDYVVGTEIDSNERRAYRHGGKVA